MAVEEDCPICDSGQDAKETFAAARIAEHIQERASHDEGHRSWIEEHTTDGTLNEIRSALRERGAPTE